jgi:hypothetical protein
MPNTPPRLVAGGTINPCRFVKMSTAADDRCLEADANEDVIGVSYEGGKYAPLSDLVTTNPHAIAGDPVGLYGDGDQCLLELGADAVRGNKLKSDADGKGVPIATTGTTLQRYGAMALESGKSGEKIRVFVQLGSERPAIT